MAETDQFLLANRTALENSGMGVAGPSAIELLLALWPSLRTLPAVAALLAACERKESPRHREVFAQAEKGALPDLENYARIGIGYGLQVLHGGGDVHSYAVGLAERLDLALAAEGEVYQFVAPLLGFEAPNRWRLTLSNNVVIRQVAADEEGRFLGNRSILGRYIEEASPFPPSKPVGWLLSLETRDKPRHNSGAAYAFNSFSSVVNALRTFKQGQVGFPGIGAIHLPYGTISSGMPNPWFPGFGVWSPFGPDYRIDPAELKEFDSFMTCALPLLDPSRDHPLGIAAGRVSDAQIRPFDRDRILDAATALEAVLTAGRADELRFQVSLRGSHLLGVSPSDRKEVFRVLYEGYGRRNKLIHGGRERVEKVGALEFVEMARRAVKAAILFSPLANPGRVCELLDEFAIRRGPEESFHEFLTSVLEAASGVANGGQKK